VVEVEVVMVQDGVCGGGETQRDSGWRFINFSRGAKIIRMSFWGGAFRL